MFLLGTAKRYLFRQISEVSKDTRVKGVAERVTFMLVQVVESCGADAQMAFIHSRGLKLLCDWLEAVRDSSDSAQKCGQKVLAALKKLPIDVAALQGSGVGK